MFVSRESRERKGNSSSFWTSKWVHLKDGKRIVEICTLSTVAPVWFNLDPLILTLSSYLHPTSFTFSVSLHGVVSRWFLSISLAASLLAPACVLPNKTASYAGKRKGEFTLARAQTALRSRFTAFVFPVFLPFERLPRTCRLLSIVLFQIGFHSLLHFFFQKQAPRPSFSSFMLLHSPKRLTPLQQEISLLPLVCSSKSNLKIQDTANSAFLQQLVRPSCTF